MFMFGNWSVVEVKWKFSGGFARGELDIENWR